MSSEKPTPFTGGVVSHSVHESPRRLTETEQLEFLQKLRERLKGDFDNAIDRAFDDFASLLRTTPYANKVTFDPPVRRDHGAFRSFVSRVLEKLHADKKMEYRIVEGKPGEVVTIEFNATSLPDKEAVERYAKWVQQRTSAPPE
jgi:hypothetical protein